MGSSPCRRYSLLGVAHPSWDNPFKYKVDTDERRSDEVVIKKKANMWPIDTDEQRSDEVVIMKKADMWP